MLAVFRKIRDGEFKKKVRIQTVEQVMQVRRMLRWFWDQTGSSTEMQRLKLMIVSRKMLVYMLWLSKKLLILYMVFSNIQWQFMVAQVMCIGKKMLNRKSVIVRLINYIVFTVFFILKVAMIIIRSLFRRSRKYIKLQIIIRKIGVILVFYGFVFFKFIKQLKLLEYLLLQMLESL